MTRIYTIDDAEELYHYGIIGQKWGVRRYQNKDGSLTKKGKQRYSKLGQKIPYNNEKHYDVNYKKVNTDILTDDELKYVNARLAQQVNFERLSNEYNKQTASGVKKLILSLVNEPISNVTKNYVTDTVNTKILKKPKK